MEVLSHHGYHLDRALDYFFSSGASSKTSKSSSTSKADASKLLKLFEKYSGSTDEKACISDEKLAPFFTDIGVPLEGPVSLGLAWQLKCKNYGDISKKEFMDGFAAMGADSLDKMKNEVKRIESSLKDKKSFKDFYRWLFEFIKDEEERKTVDAEVACETWGIVLPMHWTLTEEWVQFVVKQKTKSVAKDLWEQVFEFAKDVKPDLSNYDEDGAWPVLIDQFVEHIRSQKK